eukprot:2072668-Prorocentrum_lima.AAC.1
MAWRSRRGRADIPGVACGGRAPIFLKSHTAVDLPTGCDLRAVYIIDGTFDKKDLPIGTMEVQSSVGLSSDGHC